MIFHKLLSALLKLIYRSVIKNNRTQGFWEVSARDQGTAYEVASVAEWHRSSLPASPKASVAEWHRNLLPPPVSVA